MDGWMSGWDSHRSSSSGYTCKNNDPLRERAEERQYSSEEANPSMGEGKFKKLLHTAT